MGMQNGPGDYRGGFGDDVARMLPAHAEAMRRAAHKTFQNTVATPHPNVVKPSSAMPLPDCDMPDASGEQQERQLVLSQEHVAADAIYDV